MEKKNIDWANLGFGYLQTDYRFVSNYKNGAWDEGALITDANIVLNECAGVLQYAQTVFEGLKAYTTKDGKIVTFRPDLNGERLEQSRVQLVLRCPFILRTSSLKQLRRLLRRMKPSCLLMEVALPYISVPICLAAILLSA